MCIFVFVSFHWMLVFLLEITRELIELAFWVGLQMTDVMTEQLYTQSSHLSISHFLATEEKDIFVQCVLEQTVVKK